VNWVTGRDNLVTSTNRGLSLTKLNARGCNKSFHKQFKFCLKTKKQQNSVRMARQEAEIWSTRYLKTEFVWYVTHSNSPL
jgi:NOL1/NOP2/fmu family ribosome biogenesis protein